MFLFDDALHWLGAPCELNNVCVLTTKESRPGNAFKRPSGLGCRPFQDDGSVVVDVVFYVPLIVCWVSVLVFVLVCITLSSF